MQRLSGLLLMLAGAALGVYTYLPAPQDGAEKLAEMTRISAAPDRDGRASPTAERTFATRVVGTAATVVAAGTPNSPAPAAASSANKGMGTWSTVVTADAAKAPKLSSSKPGDAETRWELARDLQKELKRVGCYNGEITGYWSPATKRSMSEFMDRVNATLPVDEPDYILLTLVQGHAAAACGVDCPAGQSMSSDGRCVPQAVMAQVQKKAQREEQRRIAEENRAAEKARAASERQRLAAQKSTPRAEPNAVAAAEPEKLPWLTDDGSIAQPAARRDPLPGMMSVGGPVTVPVPSPDASRAVVPKAAATQKMALADPGEDADISSAAPEFKVPKPVPAIRPRIGPDANKSAGIPGLPGGKSGVTVRPTDYAKVSPSMLPPRRIVAVRAAPLKVKYYASNEKVRRGQPRQGTMRYNLMQALGGIY